ncbi:MAG: hypothetical protein P8X74_23945 [Reinekea sp.]
MLPKNFSEPMGAPAVFSKQIETKLLHSASTEGVTDTISCVMIMMNKFLCIDSMQFRQAVCAKQSACVWV